MSTTTQTETLSPDAMRVTPDGAVRTHEDQCDGSCHDRGDDDCCLNLSTACDDCLFYAAQDAERA